MAMHFQLEHQHSKFKKQTSVSSIKPQSPTNSKIKKEKHPIDPPETFVMPPNPQQQVSKFNFHLQGLNQIQKESIGQMPLFVATSIQKRKRLSQQRIYEATANTSADFLNVHFRDFKTGLKSEVEGMFNNIHNQIFGEIWDGKYDIEQNRKKYFISQNKEQKLLTYITEQLVRKNLDTFRQQLDQNDDDDIEVIDIFTTRNAKTQSFKTKKAQDFVNKIREKQAKHLEELQKRLEQQKIKQYDDMEQRQFEQQQRRRQKKELIRQRMERKNELALIQKQRQSKIQAEYLKMVSQSKIPLYKLKEQQYKQFQLKEKKKKFRILQNLKDQKMLDFDQIQQHKIKYTQLLKEYQQFRQQQKQLRQSEEQVIANNRPYRGKFRSLVVNNTQNIEEKMNVSELVKKKIRYADYVKNNFIPRIDGKKHEELQSLISRTNHKHNNNEHSRRYMEYGKRNLERLHLMIGQLRQKGQLKESGAPKPVNQTQSTEGKYKNYLSELKLSKSSQRGQNMHFQSKDYDQIRLFSKLREEKAKQKQQFLKKSIQNIDMQAHMQGSTIVQQNYIDAASAKMALLKKYKLEDSNSPGIASPT